MATSAEEERLPSEETTVNGTEDSSCYEEKKLRESLQSSQVDNMLTFLANKADLRLVNQQRDEPDLTSKQKLEILTTVLESSPLSFLKRFGKHLEQVHLDCFEALESAKPEDRTELRLLVKSLRQSISGEMPKETKAKNRRYEALSRLVDNSDYFTEAEMQRRDPILYDQLIGRYHTKEERAAFLKLLDANQAKETCTPLSDMLMAHMDRMEGEVSQRRMDQEDQLESEQAARDADRREEEGEDDEMEYEEEGAEGGMAYDEFEGEEIEEDEKELLKEEFFTTMYTRFLEGKDQDFDYATVDENEEYDVGETLEQDAEDKYFDADDSEGSCSDKSKMSTTTAEGNAAVAAAVVENGEESEDELDLYMKNIEQEVKSQRR